MEKKAKKSMRSDTEILKDLIDAVIEYDSLRDDKCDFLDNHDNTDMWGDDEDEEYEELVANIRKKREEVRNLIVEATGDETISF